MLNNQATRINFDFKGEEIHYHIEGEMGVKLIIACFHPIFKKKFDRFAIECHTSPATFLLPEVTNPDYLFFDAMYKALVNQVQ